MEYRIADTFTDSLARLSGDEQKAAKITATDLLLNLNQPGLQLHKLEKSRDKNFWSLRVNSDLRIIIHRSGDSLLLCYVGHHDHAYQWAERRKLEIHPKTGAAQLVEIRELVRDVEIWGPNPPPAAAAKRPFDDIPESELLGYGIPREWLEAVRGASEDDLLDIAGHLPAEAAEALLNIAVGLPALRPAQPTVPTPKTAMFAAMPASGPFEHPDARRRFRTIANADELRQALDYPWEKWAIFLHPAQRQLVDRSFNGPARASGSAGTGKTIVALHRAAALARAKPQSRVLLTTFSETLAHALRNRLRLLLVAAPRLAEQIEVESLDAVGARLFARTFGSPKIVDAASMRQLLTRTAISSQAKKFSARFLEAEWEQVVDAWQIRSWEQYRDVSRLGRKTRLPESARRTLWSVFEKVLGELDAKGLVTHSRIFFQLATHFAAGANPPYDFLVVDEAQDVSIAQLKFLASIGGTRPDSLFFAGDPGQRIFQQPFSWRSLGVDIRGRSSTLRINYRTSQQIRLHADRLLGPDTADVDGNSDSRATVSLFEGVAPEVAVCPTEHDETARAAQWLRARIDSGIPPSEIAIFTRSEAQLPRALAAAAAAGLTYKILDPTVRQEAGSISVAVMHLAKGLEFRSVAVVACDDEVIPLQERIETATDPSELEEIYNTERHLLYVACTRARDHLLVTGTAPASEFLDDLTDHRALAAK